MKMKDNEIAILVNSITKSLKEHPHLNLGNIQWLRDCVSNAVLKGLDELKTQEEQIVFEDLHRCITFNINNIKKSNKCGCVFCMSLFYSSEVVEWIDNDQTARCPYCGIDSVLCDFDYPSLDRDILIKMHNEYFN